MLSTGDSHQPDLMDAPSTPIAVGGYVRFAAWLAGSTGLVWLVGFPAGGALAALAYTRLSNESWRTSAGLAVSLFAFVWLLDNVLGIPFPEGALISVVR